MNRTVNSISANNYGTLLFNILIAILFSVGIAFFITVIMAVFISFPGEFWVNLNLKEVIWAVFVSLQTSISVVFITLLMGTPIAYFMAMYDFRGKRVLDTILDLPIIMPPLVSGLALLMILGPEHPIGRFLSYFDMSFIFTKKGIVTAQVFVAAPFFIKTVKESIAMIPKNLIRAADTLHASRFFTFRKVILPLSRDGMIAGIAMCWARALGEFGATAMVAGSIPGKTETITLAIYSQSMTGDLDSAVVLALCLTLFSFSALLIIKHCFSKKYGFKS